MNKRGHERRCTGGATEERIAALKNDPRFTEALRGFAETIASQYRNRWLLNRLLNDRGRFLLVLLALDLHYYGEEGQDLPGLTAGRLKTACVSHGVCSAGRATAMLATMRLFGLLSEGPGRDRRERRLIPTEQLLAIHRERLVQVFTVIAGIMPEGAMGTQNLGREDFLAAFVHALMDCFRSGLRPLDWAPELTVFADRDGGMPVALALLANHLAQGAKTNGPSGDGLTIAGIAARYSVSRAHVLSILRQAEAAGLILRTPDNRITVTPQMVDRFKDFFAGVVLLQCDAITKALASSPPPRSRRA
ncbi:hypothetical protein [Chelatococcus asaccharovorans]|uniref:Uncharacterized protein n=1 Tax=Chelatococcus asaccharovorans TaxID=28210 RepID=A0A2V3TVG5_9HYPH|nr:hypothetical protein [Chelatococcus asaccharovorans]MBS7702598.1 hypothetical protein [Chelatococcus asaccharovorans]PXW52201.1 hypothetical protein C7450_11765 [Chelatococcus asaccharovorans]